MNRPFSHSVSADYRYPLIIVRLSQCSALLLWVKVSVSVPFATVLWYISV